MLTSPIQIDGSPVVKWLINPISNYRTENYLMSRNLEILFRVVTAHRHGSLQPFILSLYHSILTPVDFKMKVQFQIKITFNIEIQLQETDCCVHTKSD